MVKPHLPAAFFGLEPLESNSQDRIIFPPKAGPIDLDRLIREKRVLKDVPSSIGPPIGRKGDSRPIRQLLEDIASWNPIGGSSKTTGPRALTKSQGHKLPRTAGAWTGKHCDGRVGVVELIGCLYPFGPLFPVVLCKDSSLTIKNGNTFPGRNHCQALPFS